MVVKNKIVHIVRDVIEEKRAYLLSHKNKLNWKGIKKFWGKHYRLDFSAPAEEVYRKLKKAGFSSLHLVELKCELCNKYFGLDEPFVEIIIDHGGWDDVSITFHPECVEEICKEILGE